MKPIAVLDNILVEPITENQTTAGILIPEGGMKGTQERFEGKGKVLSVGHGIRKADGKIVPQIIEEGDIIYFSRCTPIRLDGKDYVMTKEVHVLLILKDEKIKSTKS
jgi:co-chaperonin GroES (HSP10)